MTETKPLLYRVECKWTDKSLDQTWRKYEDCSTLERAKLILSRVSESISVEGRIISLYPSSVISEVRNTTLDAAIDILKSYKVPVGNSRSGELAAKWTLISLRDCAEELETLKVTE